MGLFKRKKQAIVDVSDDYDDDYDDDDDDDDDRIPAGCAACGGPYPDCTDSCPLYDD